MLTKEAKLNNNNANKSPKNESTTRQLALGVSGFRVRQNWNEGWPCPDACTTYALRRNN